MKSICLLPLLLFFMSFTSFGQELISQRTNCYDLAITELDYSFSTQKTHGKEVTVIVKVKNIGYDDFDFYSPANLELYGNWGAEQTLLASWELNNLKPGKKKKFKFQRNLDSSKPIPTNFEAKIVLSTPSVGDCNIKNNTMSETVGGEK